MTREKAQTKVEEVLDRAARRDERAPVSAIGFVEEARAEHAAWTERTRCADGNADPAGADDT